MTRTNEEMKEKRLKGEIEEEEEEGGRESVADNHAAILKRSGDFTSKKGSHNGVEIQSSQFMQMYLYTGVLRISAS